MQSEASECGLACLAMVASYYGHRIDLSTLRRQHPISLNGVTLRSVIEIARHINFTTRAVRLEPEDLKHIKRPAILHWDMNHFVVLKSVSKRGIVLHDPAFGEKRVSWGEVSKHLTGLALELTPTESFERKDERARLRLSTFLRQASGAKHALLQILALSFALELLVIAGPFYLQLAVDEVVARGDVDLLIVLALGFALVAALTVAVTWLRSLIVVILQNTLHFAWRAAVPPFDPASALVLREAAHWRRALALHLDRAGSRSHQREPDPRAHRRHNGAHHADRDVLLQHQARAHRDLRLPLLCRDPHSALPLPARLERADDSGEGERNLELRRELAGDAELFNHENEREGQ
jgi:Peptidase C39 family